ncbi:hypothetical protein LOD99_2561 [Oopsacas minuta]|uniref:UBA domain-containing protein n=1 Tax=Oopsacas minuta TaxID=111878 RepID=A0AAV7K210_9METZ|nr:hypothetical protein LOD99_2561 [Oopsacas minuta]
MSRTFQYNLDQILPVVQMKFIPNPFEKLCVKLETAFLTDYSIDNEKMDYNFDFEQDVVMKSTEQLQSVFASEPCSNGTKIIPSELVFPIEKLITTNSSPSLQDQHDNGNGSQLNIEGFDTQSTDPFQEAELKAINDIEELQTLIFPLAPLNTPFDDESKPAELSTATPTLYHQPENLIIPNETNAINDQLGYPIQPTILSVIDDVPSVPNKSDQIVGEPDKQLYVNIDQLPSSLDSPEFDNESLSPKPPIPAPRKFKGTTSHPSNSPTPQPRLTTPKSTPRAKPLHTDQVLPAPPKYQVDSTIPDNIEQTTACMPADECSPPYSQILNKNDMYPLFNPSLKPNSQSANCFALYDLTESILGDISRQVNVNSQVESLPQYQQQQDPLSEEENIFRRVVDMGFPMESVKNISISFDTKNESQLIEYMLTIQNMAESNGWSSEAVETAFILLKGETDKMKDYMETFSKYKEMGFQETKIHSALAKCGKEYEKMLEILIEST